MTENEFIELVRKKFQAIKSLENSETFYEHEKNFDQIWVELGANILEKSLGDLPNDKRKKKTIQTRFGTINIANNRYFMGNCTRQSPYLQELSVFFGQDTCYGSAEDVLHKTLRISVSDSSIFRITNQIGLDSEVFMPQSYLNECTNQAVYTMIDGSMVLTREDKWKEVKVARIFQENHHGEISKNRSEIQQSLYLAHLGGHLEFEERLQKLLDPLEKQAQTMIFINDGAIWIKDFISTFYRSGEPSKSNPNN